MSSLGGVTAVRVGDGMGVACCISNWDCWNGGCGTIDEGKVHIHTVSRAFLVKRN